MSLLAATLAYPIDPALAQNKIYMWCTVMVLFWAATIVNFFGMRVSRWLSTLSALLGTLVPFALIIALLGLWLLNGKASAIDFDWQHFFPRL